MMNSRYTNSSNSEEDDEDKKNLKNLDKISQRIQDNLNKSHFLEDDEEFDLSGVNSPRPSAMGLSFYVNLNPNGHLIIGSPEKDDVGCYKQIFSDFKVGGGRNIWKRENFKFQKKLQLMNYYLWIKKVHFYLKMNILMFSVTKDLIANFSHYSTN